MLSLVLTVTSFILLLVACVPSANAVTANDQARHRLSHRLRSGASRHIQTTSQQNTKDSDGDDSDDENIDDDDTAEAEDQAEEQIPAAKSEAESAEEAKAAKLEKLHAAVAKANQNLTETISKQAQYRKLKAHLENKEESDKEIDHFVFLVTNESESPAMAGMMGNMWKEMRMFETPSYTTYLEEEIQKLQEKEQVQRKQLSMAEESLLAAKAGKEVAAETPAALGSEAASAPAPAGATAQAPAPTVAAMPAEVEVQEKEWWLVMATWALMTVLSVVARQIFKGKTWTPQSRAPYAAALIILWTITVFATLFFYLSTHGWQWLECIYFCIVTVTTVGYGDYVPDDSILDKVLLLIFLWFNMFILSTVLSIVTSKADDDMEGPKGKGLGFQTIVLVCMVVGGGVLFMFLEDWSFLEGLTFSTVTLTTVGYGALLPDENSASMMAACVFILIGVPMTGVFVGKLAGAIDDSFKTRKQRMTTGALLGTYIGLIVAWLVLGATGFHLFNGHGWSWPECFYLAAVTMTTVGYGDLVPEKTQADHVMCIMYVWGSVLVLASVLSDLDGLLLDMITKGMKRHAVLGLKGGILTGLLAVGVVAFDFLEGWGLLNSFVYTSVTCTTVGYGHYTPDSLPSRLFAVFFLLLAVPMTGSIVGYIASVYSDEIQSIIAD